MAESLQNLVVRLEAETARYQRELDGARKKLGAFEKGANSASAASLKFNNVIKAFATFAAVRQVQHWADAYTNLQNRLKLVTNGQVELANAGEAVFDIAQRSRAELGATGELYFKIAQNAEKLGLSQNDVSRATETFAKTLALSGTSAGAAAGAIIQFSQALATGTFRGDEFNSVAEAAPALMDALARSLEQAGEASGDVRGKLRAMAAEGKLTTDKLIRALIDQSESVDAAFAKTSSTVSQSLTRVENAFINLIGKLEETTGVFEGMAVAINGVADAIVELGQYRDLLELLVMVGAGARVGFGFGGGFGAVLGASMAGAAGAINIANRKGAEERAAAGITGPVETGMSMLPDETGFSAIPDGFQAEVDAAAAKLETLNAVTTRSAAAASDHASAIGEVAEAYDFQGEAANDALEWSEQVDAMYRQNEASILGLDYATMRYNETMDQLNVLLREGVINQEQFDRAAAKSAENLDTYANAVHGFALNLREDIKQSTSSLFQNLIQDGANWKDHLLSYLAQIGDAFAKLAADMAVQALFGTTGGGGGIDWGGIISGAFGAAAGAGAAADGGFIPAGQLTLVGERGPELVMSRSAHMVLSNDDTMSAFGGRGGLTQTFNIQTPDANSFVASQRQIQRKGRAALGVA